jgi:hypothetical protein
MDSELIAKFPCGGGWWKVHHPAAGDWQQSHYETDCQPREVREEHQQPHIQNEKEERRANKQPPLARRERERTSTKTVCEYIMDAIDPCASLYTTSQKLDALQWLKQRLFNFVSSDAHLYLGPKKSRTLSMWLSGNSCKPDSESIVREFVQLLLGENAKDVVLHLDRRGQWFVKNA